MWVEEDLPEWFAWGTGEHGTESDIEAEEEL